MTGAKQFQPRHRGENFHIGSRLQRLVCVEQDKKLALVAADSDADQAGTGTGLLHLIPDQLLKRFGGFSENRRCCASQAQEQDSNSHQWSHELGV